MNDAVDMLEAFAESNEPRGAVEVLAGARRCAASKRRRRTMTGAVALLMLFGASALVVARFDHAKRDVKVITTPTHPGDAVGSVVRVPPLDHATATWLNDGTPVFVVNDRDFGVRVVDAHDSRHLAYGGWLVAFCPSDGWFEDTLHGSKYRPDGTKADGPAPTGLVTYDFLLRGAAGKPPVATITGRRKAEPWTTRRTTPPHGPSCLTGMTKLPIDTTLVHHKYPRAGQPVLKPTDANEAIPAGQVVQVDGTYLRDPATSRPMMCDEPTTTTCADPVPVVNEASEPSLDRPLTGLWIARVRAGTLTELTAVKVDPGADGACFWSSGKACKTAGDAKPTQPAHEGNWTDGPLYLAPTDVPAGLRLLRATGGESPGQAGITMREGQSDASERELSLGANLRELVYGDGQGRGFYVTVVDDTDYPPNAQLGFPGARSIRVRGADGVVSATLNSPFIGRADSVFLFDPDVHIEWLEYPNVAVEVAGKRMSERELVDIAEHLRRISSDDWKRLEGSP